MNNLSVNEMIIFLRNIPYINEGGCAIAAITIKRFLKINKNIKCDIIYRHNFKDEYNINVNALRNLDDPISCNHAFISLKKSAFDCEGKQYFKNHCIKMPEKLVIASLNKLDEWNPSFKRKKYIPIIESKLKIDLSDIKLK